MTVREVPIGKITPYGDNPRKQVHPESISRLATSIQTYGFTQPLVVDENNTVIIGNHRLKAAESLGLEKVPVYVAKHLSEAEKIGLRISDNRSHEFTGWDTTQLEAEFIKLDELGFDKDLTGFSDSEFEQFLKGVEPEQTEQPEQPSEGRAEKKNCISFTDEQMTVILNAIYKIREMEQEQNIPDNRCIELIAADFLAG
jgi:ParB-like chromosome segregation protein Spo0J